MGAFGALRDFFGRERYESVRKRTWEVFVSLVRRPMGTLGLAIILFFVAMAILAPTVAGPFPTYFPRANLGDPDEPPSTQFPLGTDANGRNNWALLAYGSRVTLLIGVSASSVAMVIGTLVGLMAGYYGRLPDRILSWVTNFFLVIPWLPFVLVIASILGRGFWTTLVAIAIVSWPTTARVVRSRILSVKTLGYVQRAHAIGARDGHVMVRHILPVLGPLIFANMILTVSTSIWTESFLAFFGLSDTTTPSWGVLIENSWSNLDVFKGAWWSFLPPGMSVTVLVLAFTMVSHVLEEILNPKLRRR